MNRAIPTPVEEGTEPLEASPAISKVIDLNESETFKVSTVLALLDRKTGFLPNMVDDPAFEVTNPVPVYSYPAPKPIGFAMVTHDADRKRIIADLFLSKSCPERLDIETRSRKLWSYGCYRVMEYRVVGDQELRSKFSILRVLIDDSQPDDERLPALGEAVL